MFYETYLGEKIICFKTYLGEKIICFKTYLGGKIMLFCCLFCFLHPSQLLQMNLQCQLVFSADFMLKHVRRDVLLCHMMILD